MNRSILIFLFWFLGTAQVAAQSRPEISDPLAGQKIERFEVSGNTSVASDTIRVYLGVHPGEVYDPAAVQRNFLNLWQTGLFDDVRIESDRGESGVIVRAIVKERPRIGAVEYRGNKNLNLAKINEALEKAKIDLHVGNTVEQTLVRRAAETIRTAYTDNGFEGVTIDTSFEDMSDPNEKRVVFQVVEGEKARVAGIEFTGNNRFSDRRLRSVMKLVKRHGPISWIRKKNLYVASKLDEDLEKVKNLYRDYGYKDVELGDPQIAAVGSGKKQRVKITVPVREGDVHKFGEVTINGNTVFPSDAMIGNWPLEKGAVLSRKPIQSRIEFFEELYKRRGYIYAYINPEYVEKDNNVVDVNIQVFEGDQFKLGRLEFEGNTTTKDKVLRREIFLEEGSVMDMETFKSSMYKLGQLGYFKVTENPDFKINPEAKTVDITVKGQEEGKNDVQFGGGYSEPYGFFGQFQFSTRNFLGEGENVGVSYQRGRRQNFFSLSYSDPWFLDRPHSFGVSIFDRQTTLTESIGLDSRGKGGSLSYGFRTGRFQSLSFLYGFERREDHTEFSPLPDENGNIPLPEIRDEVFTTSALIPSYRYDSRDNPFDTTRGVRASASVSYSGGALGGTINLLKPVANYAIFKKISRKTSASFNVEAGQIFPENENCARTLSERKQDFELCVPRSERFLIGGDQSVRGFRFGTVGPKEVLAGLSSPVGGYKHVVFNAEYVYRVNDPLRFVLWADAGNAFAEEENWDLSTLRYSTGAELRIFLPVFQFPLRLIYAFNPAPQTGDIFQAFQFSVGNTF